MKINISIEGIFEYMITIALAVLSFFAPTAEWLVFIGFLVFSDLILAVAAAVKMNVKIESRKLAVTVAKFTGYGIAILLTHYLCVLLMPEIAGAKIISSLIAVVEIKSIDEKLKILAGVSLFEFIIDKLKRKPNDK